ncbi:MAG TPA: nucleotidyltransferase family protein [Dermatophilaceae bacterium]|nr:nucleotidyltransferase family protein [Dermatophilaceae bacterium]
MTGTTAQVPLVIRVAIGHAAAQHIAEAAGIDVLHIKGPALDSSITWPGREGTDADILVRFSDARAMVSALERAGWELRSRFENSSAFQHSATLWHSHWGYLDVHRYFPGIQAPPDLAFRRLWSERTTADIAGVACPVPNLAGQILIVLLHAARAGGNPRAHRDIQTAWEALAPARRVDVTDLVDELDAHVGFAAATGHLDDFRDARDYELWSIASRGGTRFQEWKARVKAAPTRREGVWIAFHAALVNTDHMAMLLGRRPTGREVVREFFARPARGVRQSWLDRRAHRGTRP